MNLALKEWAAVIRALEDGTQILLFRKGGISETSGDFRMENNEFLLYPTYEHQKSELVKPEYRDLISASVHERTGQLVKITGFARVHRIILLTEPEVAGALSEQHIWNQAYVDMRLDYKPHKPLYVVLLRVYRLVRPMEFVEKSEYIGCKSWVPLDQVADPDGAVAVLDDSEFALRADAVMRVLSAIDSHGTIERPL